jgi:hypothetical protein
MSRLIKWHISVQDLEELFQSTFGPNYDFSVEGVEFDEVLGLLAIEILDDSSENGYEGAYSGVRIA